MGEILLLAAIALLLFGATRIADIGKGLGEGIRNFKKGLKEEDDPAPKQLEKGADADKKALVRRRWGSPSHVDSTRWRRARRSR
jgi:sec-independent protein translocase protein TatA